MLLRETMLPLVLAFDSFMTEVPIIEFLYDRGLRYERVKRSNMFYCVQAVKIIKSNDFVEA